MTGLLAVVAFGVPLAMNAGDAPAPEATKPASAEGAENPQLDGLRSNIQALQEGIRKLSGSEQGVLGELKAAESATLASQEALARAEARVREAEDGAKALALRVDLLNARLTQTGRVVGNRLDALYRMGGPRYLRVLLASTSPAGILSAYRTAAALSARDAKLLARYREERVAVRAEADRLEAMRPALAREREAQARASHGAEAALARRRAVLESIRSDRRSRERALEELQAAAKELATLTGGSGRASTPLGFHLMRGVLEWPARGPVSTPYGRRIAPGAGISLIQRGLDIDAPFGAEIRTVYDGEILFAQWLRGYGLTVIVDHGGGYLSVYGHASVLLVQKGETVARGQKIGLVGDSASLRGPYLYFEIRKDGQPVDPVGWLRVR